MKKNKNKQTNKQMQFVHVSSTHLDLPEHRLGTIETQDVIYPVIHYAINILNYISAESLVNYTQVTVPLSSFPSGNKIQCA